MGETPYLRGPFPKKYTYALMQNTEQILHNFKDQNFANFFYLDRSIVAWHSSYDLN